MPTPDWKQIEAHPEYTALNDRDKASVQDSFFKQHVEPHKAFKSLSDPEKETVRQKFFAPAVEPAPQAPAAAPQAPADQGWMGDLSNQVLGQVPLQIGETLLGGLAAADELLDRLVPEEPGSFNLQDWAGGAKEDMAQKRERFFPMSEDAQNDTPYGWLMQGLGSAGVSLGVKLPAAAIGGGLALVAGAAAPVVAVSAMLGWMTGIPLFGASQYWDALQRNRQAGLSEEDAFHEALLEGGSEMTFEALSDVIDWATLGSGRLLTAPGKEALKKSLTQMLKGSWKQAAKKGAVVFGSEFSTEMMNIGTQAEIQRYHGVGTARFWEAMADQVGPVAVASIIFSGVGGGISLHQARQVKQQLQTVIPDDVPADAARRMAAQRVAAVSEVRKAIAETNPDLADQFATYAYQAVLANQPINMSDPVDELKARKPGSGPADGPMGTAGQEATANRPGQAPPDKAAVMAQERAAAIQDMKAQLSTGQVSYIDDLLDRKGTLDEIRQAFPETPAAVRYAQLRLGETVAPAPDAAPAIKTGTARTDTEIRRERAAGLEDVFGQADTVDHKAVAAAKKRADARRVLDFVEQLTGQPVKSAQESAQAMLVAEEENKNAIARAQMAADTLQTRRGDAAGHIYPDASIPDVTPPAEAAPGPAISEGYLQQLGQDFVALMDTIETSRKKEAGQKAVASLTRGSAKTADDLHAERAAALEVAFEELEAQQGIDQVRQFVAHLTGIEVKSAAESAAAILKAERQNKYRLNKARRAMQKEAPATPATTGDQKADAPEAPQAEISAPPVSQPPPKPAAKTAKLTNRPRPPRRRP